jgi:hypothetical protein
MVMYKYEVQFNYPDEFNTSFSRKIVEVTYPKKVNSLRQTYGFDGIGKNELLLKAVLALGLEPQLVPAISDRTKLNLEDYALKYLGETEEVMDNLNRKSPGANLFQVITYPIRLVLRLVKRILFFWL